MKPRVCNWIVDVWANVSVTSVVQAFMKARIIAEQLSNSNETDSILVHVTWPRDQLLDGGILLAYTHIVLEHVGLSSQTTCAIAAIFKLTAFPSQ